MIDIRLALWSFLVLILPIFFIGCVVFSPSFRRSQIWITKLYVTQLSGILAGSIYGLITGIGHRILWVAIIVSSVALVTEIRHLGTKRCYNCGIPIRRRAQFCPFCGKRLGFDNGT